MPQLDPAPWLLILLYTWSILLVVVPPKVLAHTFPASPAAQEVQALKTEPWHWSCP
uniref:ATP synthase F0 subunit 8 n=1 Tax=Parupeneus pleurostigma TaxID=603997 RepID=UPI0020369F88|nr:ATP synthase F0 subunit 8 [Parupeneus pleurostigma]URF19478.1 ATP synthase F0 subunit 8 [Parupeneus pleurostigma]